MSISLYQIDATLQSALDTLADNGGILTPELDAILALDAEQWLAKAEGYLRVVANLEAQAAACKAEAERLTVAKRRAESQAETLRARLEQSLKLRGGEPVQVATWKLSLRGSESVDLSVEPETLPAEFQTVKVSANKTAIKAAIKSGTAVPGAQLVKHDNLQIR